MVAVQAGEGEVAAALGDMGGRLEIAAVNAPGSVVVSGQLTALEEWLPRLAGCKSSRLKVSHAFHSHLMEPMLAEFRAVARGLRFHEPRIAVVSNLDGRVVGGELTDPEYWVRHVRGAVRFADGVRTLESEGVSRFLELGPDGVLTALARQSVDEDRDVVLVPALRAKRDEGEAFAGFLAQAHVAGVEVDWPAFYAGTGARRVELPTYAFQRERFWLMPGAKAGDPAAAGLDRIDHPLLAGAVQVGDRDEWLLTGRMSGESAPWVADHVVLGTVIVPGTALVELALTAGTRVGSPVIEELVLEAPLILTDNAARLVQVMVGASDEDGRREVAIYTRPENPGDDSDHGDHGDQGEATCHARGTLITGAPSIADWPAQWPPAGATPIGVDALYTQLADAGYDYGPVFQGVRAAWRDDDAVYADIALPDETAQTATGFAIHPALLDAALHGGLESLATGERSSTQLPFSWSGVRLEQTGRTRGRVRVATAGDAGLRIDIADEHGAPIAAVERLAFRPLDEAKLAGGRNRNVGHSSLYEVDWVIVPATARTGAGRIVVLGDLPAPGQRFADLDALEHALAAGRPVPEAVLIGIDTVEPEGAASPGSAASAASAQTAQAVREVATRTLGLLQRWLASPTLADARLVLVTRNAIAVGDDSPDLALSSVWGMVRSAQSEHPERFMLLDVDEPADTIDWAALVAAPEPQLAVREGQVFAPRLTRAEMASVRPGSEWRLAVERKGSLDDLAIVPCDGDRPLAANEVRIGIRAAGLNFRDVLIALGMYPGDAPLGSEAAGVVLEVGPGVTDLAPGDRVMGLVLNSLGTSAVADRRMVVPVPAGWSFAQAASVPVVFLTAYYALVDLAGLGKGERLLVHAAAGGVGMAAVQIAEHLGAQVFATASPGKWSAVRGLGVAGERIASSRDLGFREAFLAATGGEGVDVVLNALAGEFVDASLDLLPRGGRFVEMGKADIRDAGQLGKSGVRYQAFDLFDAGPERIQQMLCEIVGLFQRGVLRHAPIRTWDVRRGVEAFRFLREGRNTGKVVLTIPVRPDPNGTVLITGGTGGLGALFARHLVVSHGLTRLVLVSRRGAAADAVPELLAELRSLGADPRVVACDVSDRDQLAAVIGALEHPLTAVVHAAGVVDDGVVAALTPDQVERVLRPKVDAALHLHELTRDMELTAFILFSSVAALIGSPGQANYAAANAVLDALAARRHAAGLRTMSQAWGLWGEERGMGGALDAGGVARWARMGIEPLSAQLGLELFDAARLLDIPLAVPVRLDPGALRASARAGTLPALLRGLVRVPAARAAAGGDSLAQRLAAVRDGERERFVLELVQNQVAAVLGHGSPGAIDTDKTFKELGLDSLAAVELRNRLTKATGLRLPSTLIFDHPTPAGAASLVLTQVGGAQEQKAVSPLEEQLQKIEALLGAVAGDDQQLSRFEPRLRSFSNRLSSVLSTINSKREDDAEVFADDLDGVSDEEIFQLIDKEIGSA
ncbi:SDR family NAD(P)-dependent oxidoreductase [Actinocrinis puniceicyclus]|uniref:SDR family NAD(P)-dependent oxidoreductase n=1 Tax=Actinocrinis puniceicyclus TaxID=977794 RepID=A0A8J8BGP7_9ACTN|nr:SDR family NAD(P)-dependent oxidoreductase [Actinocrinis puniceicyclus]MBS2965994.1 SDR family NAD(P)-dependent oxidoreductase [Actinocrinis puniceicyclus]